jgi:hypothetical protein
MAETVEGEIARNGEKKRLGRSDFAAFARPQEAQVSFLHHIVEVILALEPAAQPRTQHRLVRLHVGGEPLAKFGIGRGHRQRKLPREFSLCSRTVERIIGIDLSSHRDGRKNKHDKFQRDVAVAQAGGSAFTLLHTANFKDDGDATRHRSSVAISQGNLFLRTGTRLFALGK